MKGLIKSYVECTVRYESVHLLWHDAWQTRAVYTRTGNPCGRGKQADREEANVSLEVTL